jgi:hypothetical protein
VTGFFSLKQASNPRLQPKSPSRRNSAPRAKPTAPRASLRTTAPVGAFIIAGEPLEDCPQRELPIGEERPIASPIGAISPPPMHCRVRIPVRATLFFPIRILPRLPIAPQGEPRRGRYGATASGRTHRRCSVLEPA